MMRIATKQGLTNNMASMSGVLDQCQAHLGNPFETVFYEPFKNITGKSINFNRHENCLGFN